MKPVFAAYSEVYLKWQLGDGHPTVPERARIAVGLLQEMGPVTLVDPCELYTMGAVEQLAVRVHEEHYVQRVLWDGDLNGESAADDLDLGQAASAMFSGTVACVANMRENEYGPGVWFNPAGAKHHAMWDRAAGFCGLNDMAWAAVTLADAGRVVGYLDWDAHAGDGVQALTSDHAGVTTYSIHQGGIFPGTPETLVSRPAKGIYNRVLQQGDGDRELWEGVHHALEVFTDKGVDVLLLAAGADGLAGDPLASLEYTQVGLCLVAQAVGRWVAQRGISVLVGGAGGYQPLDETPMAWAGVVATLQREYYKSLKVA